MIFRKKKLSEVISFLCFGLSTGRAVAYYPYYRSPQEELRIFVLQKKYYHKHVNPTKVFDERSAEKFLESLGSPRRNFSEVLDFNLFLDTGEIQIEGVDGLVYSLPPINPK